MSAQRLGLDECSRTGDIVALNGTYRDKQRRNAVQGVAKLLILLKQNTNFF